MHPEEKAYEIFADLWESKHRLPRPHQFRSKTKNTSTYDELIQTYGSFDHALLDFLESYHAIHGYKHIPDYLLGALVGHAKMVIPKKSRWFLRITTSDKAKIDVYDKLMDISQYPSKRSNNTMYLRCYEDDLLVAYNHLTKESLPFRPSVDFVRGYIDTHSYFRQAGINTLRLTITGTLVQEVHDFLVQLGAKNTRVYTEHVTAKGSMRMNVLAKSIRVIRNTLYPPGCICNQDVKEKLFKI